MEIRKSSRFLLNLVLQSTDVEVARYEYPVWLRVIVDKEPKCKKVLVRHQRWWNYGVAVRIQRIGSKGSVGLKDRR